MARILVVDDESSIRYLVKKILEKEGHQVEEAEDGDEALQLLEGDRPDLILLDVMMPGTGGWEVCGKIKARDELKAIPLVMFTVRTSPDSMSRSRACGAEAHINKPFDKEELIRVVESLVGRGGGS
jgi:CheY-like chemotaxis protein